MFHPLVFLKGAGFGAGIMYFLDPVAGNRRRALVRDQIVHAYNTCSRQAEVTYRDASNRLQGVKAELQSAVHPSEQGQGLVDKMQHGASGIGRTIGMQGRGWSPTAKAVAMLGGAGLVASIMNKRDLATLALGVVGLSYVAKEIADREQMRSSAGQRRRSEQQHSDQQEADQQQGGHHRQGSEQAGSDQNHGGADQAGNDSKTSNEGTGIEASVPTEKQTVHNL